MTEHNKISDSFVLFHDLFGIIHKLVLYLNTFSCLRMLHNLKKEINSYELHFLPLENYIQFTKGINAIYVLRT